jgi:hypothetical protein
VRGRRDEAAVNALGAPIAKHGSNAVPSGKSIALVGTVQAWVDLVGRPGDASGVVTDIE